MSERTHRMNADERDGYGLNGEHSMRADLRGPSRGPTPQDAAAILIPKALAAYGDEVATLIRLGEDMERSFKAVDRVEKVLRENGCTAPRPDLSPSLRAAWSTWRGEGFWERP